MACWTRPRDCNVIVYFWISYPIYHHKWMTVSNEEIARVLFIFLRPLLLLLLFPYFRCPGDTTKSNQIKFRKLRKELVSWKNKARGPKCCYVLSLVFCSCSSSAQNIHTGQQRRADPRLYVNSYSDRNLLAYFEHWLTIYTCINYGHAGLLQFRGIRPPDFAVWP